jgi:quinol monooxygenase YgiN
MVYVVAAKWTAKAGEEDAVAGAIRQLAPASRAEPGMVMYQTHRDPEDARVFFFYEQYRDKAAYDAHLNSEHFQRLGFGDAIPRLEARERGFYETWET